MGWLFSFIPGGFPLSCNKSCSKCLRCLLELGVRVGQSSLGVSNQWVDHIIPKISMVLLVKVGVLFGLLHAWGVPPVFGILTKGRPYGQCGWLVL
jgi:hypothetical protein